MLQYVCDICGEVIDTTTISTNDKTFQLPKLYMISGITRCGKESCDLCDNCAKSIESFIKQLRENKN